jgi:hypothetical protein
MANMEQIIRPHSPPNISPPESTPKCQVPPENTVVQLDVPDKALQAALQDVGQGEPASAKALASNTTYTYSASWYMTKKEREKGKAGVGGGEDARVIDNPAGGGGGGGGGGGDTPPDFPGGVPLPRPRPPDAPSN